MIRYHSFVPTSPRSVEDDGHQGNGARPNGGQQSRPGAQPAAQLIEAALDVATQVIERLAIAVVIVDERGMPLLFNSAATELCAQDNSLSLSPNGLAAFDPAVTQELRRVSARVAGGRTGRAEDPDGCKSDGEAVSLPRGDDRCPLAALVLPIRGPVSYAGPIEAIGVKTQAALVFITDPERGRRAKNDWLRRIYGLTRTEARLACELIKGGTLEDIAARMDITMNTVRTHMKHLLSKTNAQGQGQAGLMRLLLSGPWMVMTSASD